MAKTKAKAKKPAKKMDKKMTVFKPLKFDRSFGTKVFKVRQMYDIGIISAIPAVTNGSPLPNYGAYNFTAGSIDQIASFAVIFDQYRFVKMKVSFEPMFNVDQAFGTSMTNNQTYLGQFYTVVDYDDATIPTSIAYLRQYENVKETNTMTKHVRTFTPHIAVAGYTGSFGGYTNVTAPWIDVISTSVQHYGVKYGFSGGAALTTVAQYFVRVELFIEFKNVH